MAGGCPRAARVLLATLTPPRAPPVQDSGPTCPGLGVQGAALMEGGGVQGSCVRPVPGATLLLADQEASGCAALVRSRVSGLD